MLAHAYRTRGLVWSLRAQLVTLVLVVAGVEGIVVTGTYAAWTVAAVVQDALDRQLLATHLAATFTSAYVLGAQMAVDGVAERSAMVGAVGADSPESIARDLRAFARSYRLLDALTLFDLEGTARATSLEEPVAFGLSVADREYFREALRTGRPYLGQARISRGSGQPVVPYAVPVRDAAGTPRAVLLGSISLHRLSEELGRLRPEREVRVSVIDRRADGTVVADTVQAQILSRPHLSPEVLDPLMAGREGGAETTGREGTSVLSTYAPVPGLPWAVLLEQPRAVALAPVVDRDWAVVPVGAAAAVLAAVGGSLMTLRLSRPLRALREAAEEIGAGNLSRRVGLSRSDEIGDLGRAFDAMAESLARRTAALEAARREMEDFSYAVAHELRSPLRALDGFSLSLLEEHRHALDDAARDDLRRIRSASQRMGELLDGLLALLRLGRVELQVQPVDLSQIAREVVSELQAQEPGRTVVVHIQDGLVADGDPTLLRLALHHLLDNAWKFTRPVPVPEIWVGACRDRGETAYFVRDNGVGFDMAHAANLFGAFQRLHRVEEFEGNGVGLAVVKRIIERHGGRVWAEAQAGNGATFRFTLGAPAVAIR